MSTDGGDRYFDAGGVRLRYIEHGSGEPVVLVHSYAGDLESQWTETGVLEKLARSFRVVAFDCRGHGLSDKPHDAAAYGQEMTLDIVRLLEHLGLARAHVVGYSMGAHLVVQLPALASERVLTATLGGGTGRRRWTADDERQAQREADEMERGSLRSQMLRLAAGREPPSESFIARSSAEFLRGKDCRALAAVRRSNGDQVVDDAALARVTTPVLGVVGSDDPYLREYSSLANALPQLELVVIPGAAHASAASRPEFGAAVEAFIRKHRRA